MNLKVYFKNDEIIFLDHNGKFLFSLGFKGNIEKLQEVFNEDVRKIKFNFSLIPFGISLWDISRNEKLGVITLRLW